MEREFLRVFGLGLGLGVFMIDLFVILDSLV